MLFLLFLLNIVHYFRPTFVRTNGCWRLINQFLSRHKKSHNHNALPLLKYYLITKLYYAGFPCWTIFTFYKFYIELFWKYIYIIQDVDFVAYCNGGVKQAGHVCPTVFNCVTRKNFVHLKILFYFIIFTLPWEYILSFQVAKKFVYSVVYVHFYFIFKLLKISLTPLV